MPATTIAEKDRGNLARMDTKASPVDSLTAPTAQPVPHVYTCIAAVMHEVGLAGISKSRKNAQQGYSFRGIDEVFNALNPILAKHRLVILPRILTRECVERTAKSGSAQFYVTVAAEFDFVSAVDGSTHTLRTFGEAQDSADKATNKAMSAAYKYAAFQAFCIPTEGDNDADATTPDLVAPSKPSMPEGYEAWLITFGVAANEGLAAMRKVFAEAPPAFRDFLTKHDDRYDKIRARGEAADKAKAAAPAVGK